MTQPSAGRRLRCPGCGSAFSIATLTPKIICPHCDRTHVADDLAEAVEAYGAEVGLRLDAAAGDYDRLATWEKWRHRTDPKRTLPVVFGLILGLPILFGIAGWIALRLGLIGADPIGTAIVGGSYLGLIVYVLWYVLGRGRAAEAREVEAGETRVACPNCGAPGRLEAGRGIDTCDHCGASLVPSETAMRRGVAAAAEAALKARMARHRSERAGVARIADMNQSIVGRYYVLAIFGSVPAILGVTTLVYSARMAVGTEAFHPGVLALWALFAAVVGPAAWFMRRRAERRAAWRRSLGDLARQFGGRVHDTHRGWVDWLNAHWPGEWDLGVLRDFGPSASMTARGYPVLVLPDHPDGLLQQRPPILEVLLAAWIPGETGVAETPLEPRGEGIAARERLVASGFEVRTLPCGVQARMEGEGYEAIYAHPAGAHRLAPVLSDLAVMASSAEAVPMAAIPDDDP